MDPWQGAAIVVCILIFFGFRSCTNAFFQVVRDFVPGFLGEGASGKINCVLHGASIHLKEQSLV